MKFSHVVLKSGIVKSYDFTNDFINEHKDLFDNFTNIFNEFYSNDCCVWGASENNKDNELLKHNLCEVLKELIHTKQVKVKNGFDNTRYTSIKSINDYILNYGR